MKISNVLFALSLGSATIALPARVPAQVNISINRRSVQGTRPIVVYTRGGEYFLPPPDRTWVGYDKRYDYRRAPDDRDRGRARFKGKDKDNGNWKDNGRGRGRGRGNQ